MTSLEGRGARAGERSRDPASRRLVEQLPPIALVFGAGLLLRLVIAFVVAPGQGLSEDLSDFGRWALTLADFGPGAFYANGGFTDYPPGYLYFLWPIGIVGRALGGQTPAAAEITHALLKLPAIAADIGLALLLYRGATRWSGQRAGLGAAALYLFIPFTWYDSALWGQMDAVGALVLIGALLLLIGGWSEAAVALTVFAVVIKPQFGIGLVILGPILLRRHLLLPGSGPVPELAGRLARLDQALGGWLTRRQGPERLLACALVGAVVLVGSILPFDLWRLAPAGLAGIPVVGHVAGFAGLTTSLAAYYHFLTADAFNAWALVGPDPLSHEMSRDFIWLFDSLPVLGLIPAVALGAGLLVAAGLLVVLVLLRRDDRVAILVGFTVLAFAFFALPTRVHERYQFPLFAGAAVFAATSVRWRWWYVAVGLLGAVNLHAVLTLARPGFASPGLIGAPFGDLFRSDAAVIAVSVGNTVLFGLSLAYWIRVFAWPSLRSLRLARPPRTDVVSATSDRGPPLEDRTAGLASEGGGRLDRRDLLIALLVVVVSLGMRLYRIDQPRTMYFDELYYPSTAMEFLRDWRYGITANVFEWTHPHVAKYLQAVSVGLFGNDRVVGQVPTGAPVRDAAFEPAYPDPASPGGYGGDRIAVATGGDVRVAPHAALDAAVPVPLAGASAIAFDGEAHRLYAGSDDGGIWAIEGSSAVRVGTISGPVRRLTVVARDRLVASTGDDRIVLVDGTSGTTLASASLPGLSGMVRATLPGTSMLVASVPSGLVELDPATLRTVAQASLAAPPAGLDFVDGSDFGWRNQDTLPAPHLYVALTSNAMAAVRIEPDGQLTPADTFPMPGPVSDVRWDRPTNMVYALGHTAEGAPTVYVVEPHTDHVFADVPLPFEPAAWVFDVQPDTPGLDRQRAFVFAPDGEAAIASLGNQAVAWRLPGVLAGATTMGLLYLLTRMLFRRRIVAYLLAVILALDGLLFSQGRIGTNDAILGFFIVAALTLLAGLLRDPGQGRRKAAAILLGLPAVGVLLGLALATKWVGAYAIGAAVLLVLVRTPVGRRLAVSGLLGLTSVFGYLAVAGDPPNYAFLVLMVGITVLAGVAVARDGRHQPAAANAGEDGPEPHWVDPLRRYGIPFAWAVACLTVVPLVVYGLTYVPWALSASGGPQLFPGWPPGHTGQTFLDLQAQMYHYHADLRTPHGNGSPWWAWPFDLRPIWGYYDTYSDGSQALMFMTGNPVLMWLSVPAIAFGGWRAWRQRTPGLLVVLIAFLALWLPWARIDRVAFNYHYYVPLMFAFILLAYFLADLWEGPSRRTWNLARVAFALVLLAPALLWIFKDNLCAVAGVAQVNPTSYECTRPLSDVALPVGLWLAGSLIVGWLVLRIREPRRLVGAVLVTAGAAFVALYPALSALPIPNGWPLIYQGLLPTWDVSFQFASNTQPAVDIPLLGPGPIVVLLLTVGLIWLAVRASRRGWVAEAADRAFGDKATVVDRIGIPVGLFGLAWLVYAVINHGRPARFDYFVPLADAFTHGQLGLSATYSWLSEVVFGTNYLYNVVYPPAPAVVLMPVVLLFGPDFEQAWASILVGAANVALVSLVIRQMGVARLMRIVLSLVFAIGTIVWYSAQVGTSWHFAHVVATFFMLLAILACQRDARTWLIGLLFAGAVLSRLPVALAAPFFIAYLADRSIREPSGDRTPFGSLGSSTVLDRRTVFRIRQSTRLALPMAIGLGVPLLAYLAYNWLRFGSAFENGYSLLPGILQLNAFQEGFFSIAYIPKQLTLLLASVPAGAPDLPWLQPFRYGGPSILVTSPIFLWAFKARRPDLFNLGAWAAVILTLIPSLTFGGTGDEQFGYRFAQDVYPFLLMLTVRGLGPRISPLGWAAIGIGAIVNLWGMAAAYLNWWA